MFFARAIVKTSTIHCWFGRSILGVSLCKLDISLIDEPSPWIDITAVPSIKIQ